MTAEQATVLQVSFFTNYFQPANLTVSNDKGGTLTNT